VAQCGDTSIRFANSLSGEKHPVQFT
jgi:hypothetical protein